MSAAKPQSNKPSFDTAKEPSDIPNDQTTAEADAETKLQAELQEIEAKASEHWERYLRTAAELENLRKRAERDVENAHKYGIETFCNELLNVVDSLEMGLAAGKDAEQETITLDGLLQGSEMTLKLFIQTLEKFGVQVIDPLHAAFNPEEHEAMATQPSTEHEPHTVLEVVQKGYRLHERILRPARVIVAASPAQSTIDDA